MSKFKIKMKLQGLELEIEGSREDAPLITQNLGQQLAGLLRPTGAILEGQLPSDHSQLQQVPTSAEEAPPPGLRRKSRRRKQSINGSAENLSDEVAVDWKHDPTKYGTPKQSWSTADKSIWTLYVVAEETDEKELSGPRIAQTFNKHFRQAGTILAHNVNRDLGRHKVKKKGHPPVSEDTTKTPARWFLTEEGKRMAQALVADALGRAS